MRPEPDVNYAMDPYGYRPPARRRLGLGLMVPVVAVLGFAGAVVYYYGGAPSGVTTSAGGLPVIEADPSPTKLRPEQPGGITVPNQDKLVYERLRNAKLGPTTERLLPPPEEPLPRPIVAPQLPPPVAVTAPVLTTMAQEAQAKPAVVPAETAALPAEPAPPPPAQPPAAAAPKPVTPPPALKEAPKEPPKEAAKPPAATGGPWRIQLASVRSEEEAKSEWHRLSSRYPDELGGMALQVLRADLGEKGIYYRVQGASGDEEKARNACARLKALNVGCVLVRP